jgi:hypothetical protein
MSVDGGFRAPILRVALAAIAVVDLLSFVASLHYARAAALAHGQELAWLGDLLSQPIAGVIVACTGVAGAVAFGARPGRALAGLVTVAALALLSTAHAQLFGSPWRHLYYSGLCLTGWLLGLAVSRRRGVPDDESYARTGAMALLGTAYLNAAISKIVFGGWEWASSTPIQAIILGQEGLVPGGIVDAYRNWTVTSPLLATAFAMATVVVEASGPLMLLGGRTRRMVALGLVLLHANIYVLTPVLYWQSMLLLVLFGFSSDPPAADDELAGVPSLLTRRWVFTGCAAMLAVVSVVAIAHQARRAARYQRGAATSPPPPAPPSPAPAVLRLGPFAVSQRIAGDWSVDSLAVDGEAIVAVLTGTPGRAELQITCAPSEHQSRWHLGGAQIFYSSEVTGEDLDPVGAAVRQQIERATEGQDVCAALAQWRNAAAAQHSGP